MGKNQHSKDRLFITATEWSQQYGGKKRKATGSEIRPLPFDHCALSLSPFTQPCLLPNNTGVVFDYDHIVPYLKKYHCDPVTGQAMAVKDIISLQMSKNAEGQWECPITNKVFTPSSHIVAIRTTGNVYSYNAVEELNLRPKNFTDLIDGSKFTRADIVTIQDPQNPDIMAQRDINAFTHLQQIRTDAQETKKLESQVRHSSSSEAVMKEIDRVRAAEKESGQLKKTTEDILRGRELELADDVRKFLLLKPIVTDVNPGQVNTDGRAGMSFTSTSSHSHTSNETRLASPEEIREARWKIMRKLNKKSFVQLQTTLGNLNVELHSDMTMRTCWNFLTLCKRGYYNGIKFHRLIPGFMVQGGDPTGTGTGGESAFSRVPFKDEFDARLTHATRGTLSMANSGMNTNGSQFFITFKECKHLDNKHTVFGRVVGGLAVLDKIEQVGSDKRDRPVQDIEIIQATVFSDPIDEADQFLEDFIRKNMETRLANKVSAALPAPTADDEPTEDAQPKKLQKL